MGTKFTEPACWLGSYLSFNFFLIKNSAGLFNSIFFNRKALLISIIVFYGIFLSLNNTHLPWNTSLHQHFF